MLNDIKLLCRKCGAQPQRWISERSYCTRSGTCLETNQELREAGAGGRQWQYFYSTQCELNDGCCAGNGGGSGTMMSGMAGRAADGGQWMAQWRG